MPRPSDCLRRPAAVQPPRSARHLAQMLTRLPQLPGESRRFVIDECASHVFGNAPNGQDRPVVHLHTHRARPSQKPTGPFSKKASRTLTAGPFFPAGTHLSRPRGSKTPPARSPTPVAPDDPRKLLRDSPYDSVATMKTVDDIDPEASGTQPSPTTPTLGKRRRDGFTEAASVAARKPFGGVGSGRPRVPRGGPFRVTGAG